MGSPGPYQRCVPSFAPFGQGRPAEGREVLESALPQSRSDAGDEQVSQVPGEPCCRHARVLDPGGTTTPGQVRCSDAAPVWHKYVGSREPYISRLNSRALPTRCLRFVPRITPGSRKTRFRLLARLYRVGLVTHRVPVKGFRSASCVSSSLPKLSWRNVPFAEITARNRHQIVQ